MITKNGKYVGGRVGHAVSEEARAAIALASRRYTANESFFSSVDTEEKAYVLGFVATDGHVSEDGVRWTLQASDMPILERIREAMGSNHPIKPLRMKNSGGTVTDGVYMTIYSKRLVSDLRALGMEKDKTRTVQPWTGSANLQHHYWRGCMDGDGWLIRHARGFTAGFSGNEQMVKGFRDFILARTNRNANVRPIGSIFRVEYSGVRPPKDVARTLYENASIFLPRKKEMADLALVTEPQRRTYRDLSPEQLTTLHANLGQWTLVANELGMSYEALYQVRERLGMEMSKERRWSNGR